MLVAALIVSPAPAVADVAPGYKVYVANSGRDFNGNTGPHNIAIFSVRADGGLTPFGQPVPTGAGARALEFSGRFGYLAALEENAVYAYTRDPSGGLTPLARVGAGGEAPFGLAVAPDGKSLYTANSGDDTVSRFKLVDGVPVLAETVSTEQSGVRNVIVSRDGRFLFVSHGAPDSAGPDPLVVFPITGGGLGSPSHVVLIGGGGFDMASTPDGQFLYVACAGTNDVFALSIGPYGALTVLGRFPAPRTPEGLSITPDGRRIFVTSVASQPVSNPAEAGVWTFTIERDGTLTRQGPRVGSGIGPGVAAPDGTHLFTGDFFQSTMSAFDIATGVPREIADSPYPSRGLAPGFDGVTVR